ncbi:MAG: bifunctional 5,10-methylenetetrahydrofolate dehydrogenase/5,10-methenyltetrahydrofolate cyclohydrolase [Parasporobacterium sp.]|nr:bifunctional 5,10-methylenetetrahydrofolate dehydrogenase/5,10-methenyltetrahydrofolate cyclohydrolase [Parasporobacterium sp.]
MAQIVKGADVAAQLKEQMKAKIEELQLSPCLAIVRVGAREDDLSYERGVKKTCDAVGIEARVYELPEDITQENLEAEFKKVNDDPTVSGILLFRPLPKHLNDEPLVNMINPDKDMDCMCPMNWAKLAMGDESGYQPCTAEAVIKICEYMGVNFAGANAVVMGRSQVIGRPVGLMLLSKHCSVSWCHSKTKDMAQKCEQADIIVAAVGRAGLVTGDMVKGVNPECVAVDVGMNFVDGHLTGDLNFDEVAEKVAQITPVPGGVGAVTNTIMASHIVRAAIKAKTGEVYHF